MAGRAARPRGCSCGRRCALAAAVGVPFVVYARRCSRTARGTAPRVGVGPAAADGLAKWERLDQIAHVDRFVVVHPRMLAGAGLLLVALAVAPLARRACGGARRRGSRAAWRR